MFKKLRIKFSLFVSFITLITLLLIVGSISLGSYISTTSSLKTNISEVEQKINDDKYNPFRMSTYIYCEYTLDPFTIKTKKTNSQGEQKNLEDSALSHYYLLMKENNKEYGFIHTFYYKLTDSYFVLIDSVMEKENMYNLITNASYISFSSFILISLFAIIFSKKVIKPYETLYRKEKMFITDISHELKTPLAIISANNEVLELSNKDNEWIASNKKQIERMNKLILDMIDISKMEEIGKDIIKKEFNISDLLYENLDLYKSQIIKKNLKLESDIKDDIKITLNEESIAKLIQIFLDNAIKYASSYIKVELKGNKKDIELIFKNDSDNLDQEKIKHLFDRFYVVDKSRNKEKSGFGIGLSIAYLIINNNNGKIDTKLDKNNEISFIIKFNK